MPPGLRLAVLTIAVAMGAGLATFTGADAADPVRGLQGEYFDAADLTGTPLVTRVDPTIDFDWGLAEPVPGTGDTFSVRWKGTITPRYTERYTFRMTSDDGVRLYIDGQPVIDEFKLHSTKTVFGTVDLVAGTPHAIEVEYFDGVRHANVRMEWQSASQPRELVPQAVLTPPAGAPQTAVTTPGGSASSPVAPSTPLTQTDAVPPLPALPPVEVPAPASVLPPPETPVAGETFNAAPEGDGVLVRRPGDGSVIELDQPASLPVGTRVDARQGEVEIHTAPAAGTRLKRQAAKFRGGNFRVGQPRRGDRVVSIDLIHGEFAELCPDETPTSRSRARAAGSRRTMRTLWGSGKGRFRTRGRHAAATVRGTVWNVEDRCDATVVRVREGAVDVEDFGTGETKSVKAGQQYVARP